MRLHPVGLGEELGERAEDDERRLVQRRVAAPRALEHERQQLGPLAGAPEEAGAERRDALAELLADVPHLLRLHAREQLLLHELRHRRRRPRHHARRLAVPRRLRLADHPPQQHGGERADLLVRVLARELDQPREEDVGLLLQLVERVLRLRAHRVVLAHERTNDLLILRERRGIDHRARSAWRKLGGHQIAQQK